MPAIAGLRGTGDWGTDERPKNFRENILWMNPNGTAPIFALTAKAKKRTVDDPEFSWWNESNALVHLQVNGALGASDTTVVVDSTDPTASTQTLNYGTAKHLKEGDLLMVKPASDAASFTPEILRVRSVASDTTFTVERGAGGTTPASIANDLYLLLIGSAHAEGTGVPEAITRNPLKSYNYTQIFKDSYELTGTADKTASRTGSPWSNDKKRKMFDHSRAIELAFLFGQRSETTGNNGKPLRTTGGFRNLIPSANQYVYSGSTTLVDLMDRISPVFDWDTGAGDSRIVFGGNSALTRLGKILMATSNIQINYTGTVKSYGMDFTEMVMPRGRLFFKSHPLMSRDPMYTNSLFVLDFDAIRYVAMKDRDTKVKDDVQNPDEDVRRGFIMTECGLQLDFGGNTCAYIGNITT